MAEDFHVDLSNSLYRKGTTGISCINSKTKEHNGCALPNRMKRQIKSNLCIGTIRESYAKFYSICIYFLIRNRLEKIKTLIICNDEEFSYVREYLYYLLNDSLYRIHIINITEFQKQLGRKVKSLADNSATAYRKRALKKTKWDIGIKLNVVDVTYEMIKNKWEILSKINLTLSGCK